MISPALKSEDRPCYAWISPRLSLSHLFFFLLLGNRLESLDSGLEHWSWHGATQKNHVEALRNVPGHVAYRARERSPRTTGCTAFPAILALLTLHKFFFCYSIDNPSVDFNRAAYCGLYWIGPPGLMWWSRFLCRADSTKLPAGGSGKGLV
jgi:hypothetical protein